ncbi:MAG: hypothetical protein WB491_07760 [Candidatus Aquilonibacter sp.]
MRLAAAVTTGIARADIDFKGNDGAHCRLRFEKASTILINGQYYRVSTVGQCIWNSGGMNTYNVTQTKTQ